jgi:hypothetical protein
MWLARGISALDGGVVGRQRRGQPREPAAVWQIAAGGQRAPQRGTLDPTPAGAGRGTGMRALLAVVALAGCTTINNYGGGDAGQEDAAGAVDAAAARDLAEQPQPDAVSGDIAQQQPDMALPCPSIVGDACPNMAGNNCIAMCNGGPVVGGICDQGDVCQACGGFDQDCCAGMNGCGAGLTCAKADQNAYAGYTRCEDVSCGTVGHECCWGWVNDVPTRSCVNGAVCTPVGTMMVCK